MGLLAVSRSLPLIAVTALLTGVATDIYRPACERRRRRPRSRCGTGPRAFALIYWAVNLGVSVSGVLGGLLAERGWWILFTRRRRDLPGLRRAGRARGAGDPAAAGARAEPGGYGPVLRDRLAVSLAAMALVSGVVYLQAYIALPLAMTRDGLSPAAYGVAYAVNPVTVLLDPAAHAALADPAAAGPGLRHLDAGRWASASA